MNNVIQFPVPDHGAASSAPPASGLQAQPAPRGHAVQFYETEEFLFDTVAQFLAAGLQAGDRVLVIATPAHRAGFLARLHASVVEHAIDGGQLTLIDAEEMLSKFLVHGMPDRRLFRDALEPLMQDPLAEGRPPARVRAFGEMVDLLWRAGNSRAAIRLEELWNEAGQDFSFSLLCAYIMGNFYKEGDTARFLEVCRNHSHVVPTEAFVEIDDQHARLREISLLQQRARALESEIHQRKELENALRDALSDRSRVELELRASLERERKARAAAEASHSFKEMFVGILGHDLRNPLNTILTTARLMTIRKELPFESQKRLERVVSSGVRMQRMIEQILDMTRDRLTTGIPITRGEEQDLVSVVTRIVEEIRVANPGVTIDFEQQGVCLASVDADRFEQVVSNLVGNAVAHGDAARPISVALVERGWVASLSVHNFGPPIDPEFMPLLFDPFKRADKPRRRSEALGLGLYISDRIVRAHGGRIEVASSPDDGTRFAAIFPRYP